MIQRCYLMSLGWLLIASSAGGQTAILTGPDRAEPNAPIFLSVAGSEGPDGLDFASLGPDGTQLSIVPLFDASGTLVYAVAIAPASGRYTFALLASAGEARDLAIWDVIVGEIKPDPDPPPSPEPEPPTDPVFRVEPTRPETRILLDYAQNYGQVHMDPIPLAIALEFFGREVEAGTSSPGPETTRDWIKARVAAYGGSPDPLTGAKMDNALSEALKPAYRADQGEWQIVDRPYLAEVLRIMARGIFEGGSTR